MARPQFPPARAGCGKTFLIIGLPILVGVGLVLWSMAPSVPSRQESEQQVASIVGGRERTTVTATCDEPDRDGWSCRLRDAAGRYGWASGSATNEPAGGDSDARVNSTSYTWDFPVSPDGVVREEIAPVAQVPIENALLFVTFNALRAVDGGSPPAFDCPSSIAVGTTAACTGKAPIPTVSVTRLDRTRYEVTFTVSLPRT